MKVVIDANVVVSAALTTHATAATCIRNVVENHELLMSEECFSEYRTVLERRKIQRASRESARETLLEVLFQSSVWISISQKVAVCRDPKDDHLLELALSGAAEVLVTGDRDLLDLNGQFPFSIISPRDFLDLFLS